MPSVIRMAAVMTLFAAAAATPSSAFAQAPRETAVRVVVADQTGAIIVNAAVRLQPIEPSGPARETVTNDQGEAVFAGVAPGRYAIRAEFPGFDPRQIDDVRVRAGNTVRRDVKLSIAKLSQDVQVGQDPRDRALDPRGNSFGNVLTREQIEALPDDPDDMEETLKQMAGPGATVRVDGFRGGRLPPKSQIQSIRFRRDLFAAENHGGGMVFVDIQTRPGGGPLRGTVDFTFRDESLNARNAFAPRSPPEQQHNGTITLNGTLIKDRTGFSFTTNGVNAYDSKTVNAVTPSQPVVGSVERPADRAAFSARVDHALTKSRSLRVSYDRTRRAATTSASATSIFPSVPTPATRRRTCSVSRCRDQSAALLQRDPLSIAPPDERSSSLSDEPALLVLDAFSSGGAQIEGGRSGTDFELASDWDYAVGRHSARAGVLFEGGRYRSDDASNMGVVAAIAAGLEQEAGAGRVPSDGVVEVGGGLEVGALRPPSICAPPVLNASSTSSAGSSVAEVENVVWCESPVSLKLPQRTADREAEDVVGRIARVAAPANRAPTPRFSLSVLVGSSRAASATGSARKQHGAGEVGAKCAGRRMLPRRSLRQRRVQCLRVVGIDGVRGERKPGAVLESACR